MFGEGGVVFCPDCGQPAEATSRHCSNCGRLLSAPLSSPRPSAPGSSTAEIGQGSPASRLNGLALWSLILGILSWALCGLTSVPGVIVGGLYLSRRRTGRVDRSPMGPWGFWLSLTSLVMTGLLLAGVGALYLLGEMQRPRLWVANDGTFSITLPTGWSEGQKRNFTDLVVGYSGGPDDRACAEFNEMGRNWGLWWAIEEQLTKGLTPSAGEELKTAYERLCPAGAEMLEVLPK